MSCTEIYSFDTSGTAHLAGTANNSWLGAMAIWRIKESRYLPPYRPADLLKMWWYKPDLSREEIEHLYGYVPSRVLSGTFSENGGGQSPTQEIWDLVDNPNVSLSDRIVLFTTLDNCLVRKENIPRVITAMRSFPRAGDEMETNLLEQIETLEGILNDPDSIAVGWNQTSVCADSWDVVGEDSEGHRNGSPYNCLKGKRHFWLFEELEVSKNGEGK